jgi:lysophospholipase L1-like esterase
VSEPAAGRRAFPRLVNDFRRYRFADEHRYVEAIAAEHGFLFVDLLPAFVTCREETGDSLKLDHFHPSAEGHRCAAEAVAAALVERGPVSARPRMDSR